MRILGIILIALGTVNAIAAEPSAQSYPLWDGHETIVEYAKRSNLPPAKALNLGRATSLELVLIPAGTFVMGTPDPLPVNEKAFRINILTGQVILSLGGSLLALLLGGVVIRAICKRQRLQFSLARLLAITVAAGVGMLGAFHWRHSRQAFDAARVARAFSKHGSDMEKPAHEVTLTRPFYIGKYEITQQQYQLFMETNPSGFKGLDLPVCGVTWDESQEFCLKVSATTGLPVHLPTEAQWEHACRAGSTSRYFYGDSDTGLDSVAWYERNSGREPHPVGQKLPNAWGAYDMQGNACEWCEDLYGNYTKGAFQDPKGATSGRNRVLRGSSFANNYLACRSASRFIGLPRAHEKDYGFRVVVPVSP